MEKVDWKVEGMTCTNCALTINKYLEKQGQTEVRVNFIGNEVSFNHNETQSKEALAKGLEELGYHVVNNHEATNASHANKYLNTHLALEK